MASTATTRNRFEKQGTGENTNTWGTKLNLTGLDLIDAAMDGVESYALSGTKTLTSSNYAADEARMRVQNITSGTGGTVTVPSVQKMYLVRNNASGSVFFSAGGTMATIPAGSTMLVFCDGTDCYTQTPIEYAAAADVNYFGTTTESETIGTGTKTFVIEPGKLFFADQYVVMSAGSGNYMWGQVTSYDDDTGAMVFESALAFGSGTFTSWAIGVSGPVGPTGDPYPSVGSNGYKVLAVNAGATDVEWVDPRWVQISTASPSGASETAFTSLADPGYTDLLIRYSLTPSGSTTLLIDQSGPGTPSYGGADAISAATANQTNGVIEIRDYNRDFGLWQIAFYQPASWTSPDVATSTVPNQIRLVTGGLNAVKLRPTSGTFTGTITIYGRR